MKKGILYLIPTSISDSNAFSILEEDLKIVRLLKYFVVENAKTARKHLKSFGVETPLRELFVVTLDEHTKENKLAHFLQPLLDGNDVGLMSEAGCPAVADPGSNLVQLAHKEGVRVIPFVGPSSIILALMSSGANGQQFAFKGYLPKEKNERIKSIRLLEERSRSINETQIFIETPYRNTAMLDDLLSHLHPETYLSVSMRLTDRDNEKILSAPVSIWKNQKKYFDVVKNPCVFIVWVRK